MHMKDILADKNNIVQAGRASSFARNWLAGSGESRSARRRLNANLRNACRTLGMKRGKGLGMLGVGRSLAGAAFVTVSIGALPAQAGIFVNDGSGTGCQYSPGDSGKTFWDWPVVNILTQAAKIILSVDQKMQTEINCNPNAPSVTSGFDALDANGNVVPAGTTLTRFNKANQNNRVLFYQSPSGPGTDSLSLGGELFVNSGKIGLGGGSADGSMVIGNPAVYSNTATKTKLARNALPGEVSKIGNPLVQRYVKDKGLGGGDFYRADDSGDFVCGWDGIIIGGQNCKQDTNVQYLTEQVATAGATATGKNAMVFGNDAHAVGDGALALGYGANALNPNSVALGSGSETMTENEVSVGNLILKRKITNVAPGTIGKGSTDAVNGGQIFDLTSELGGAGLVQQDATTKNLTVGKDTGGKKVDLTGNEGTRLISGVTAGELKENSSEVATAGQVFATNERVKGVEGGVAGNATKIENIDTSIKNISEGKEGLVKYDADAKKLTVGADKDATNVDFTGKDKQTRLLTGLTDGVNANDAATFGQLRGASQSVATALGGGAKADDNGQMTAPTYWIANVGANGQSTSSDYHDVGAAFSSLNTSVGNINTHVVKIDGAVTEITKNIGDVNTQVGGLKGDALQWDITAKAFSAKHGGTSAKITNITDGTLAAGSTDAATAGQLFTTNGNVTKNTTDIAKNTGDITTINTRIDGVKGDSIQWDTKAEAYGAAHGFNGATGAPIAKRITNVAIGTLTNVSKDAVNGSQLFATNANVKQNTTDITNTNTMVSDITKGKAGLVQQDGTGLITIGEDAPHGAISVFGPQDRVRTITGVGVGKLSEESADAITGSQLFWTGDTTARILGGGAKLNQDGMISDPTYKLKSISADGTDADVSHHNVGDALVGLSGNTANINTRIEAMSTSVSNISNGTAGLVQQDATTKNLTVGAGKGGTEVSIADTPTATRKLSGLTAGTLALDSTDAVNGAQLFTTNTKLDKVGNSIAGALGTGASFDTSTGLISLNYTLKNGGEQTTILGGLNALDGQVDTNTQDISTFKNTITNISNGTVGLVQQSKAGENLAVGAATDGSAVDFTGTKGPRKLTGIADGVVSDTSTDAVNGKQLNKLDKTSVKFVWNDKNGNGVLDDGEIDTTRMTLAENGKDGRDGKDGNPIGTIIDNVKGGKIADNSLEAINGSQLNKVVKALGGEAGFDADGKWTAPNYKIDSYEMGGTSIGNSFDNVGRALAALNANDKVFNDRFTGVDTRLASLDRKVDYLDKHTLQTDKEGRFSALPAVSGGDKVPVDKLIGDSTTSSTIKPADTTSAAIAADTAAIAGGAKITGLKDAEISPTSTDAVTGKQLNETNKKLDSLGTPAVKLVVGPNGEKTNTVKLEGGDPNAPVLIKNVAEAKEGTDAVNKNQLDVVDKKIVDQTNTINERVATIETRTTNTLTEANGYTDQKFDDAKRYTDTQFNKLSSDIGSVRKEAHQAAAIGLAAASLRFDSAPGKISVATGGGVWQGQAAIAFGAGYTSESGMVRANLTGAVSGEGVGVGAGVSFTLN